MKNIMVFISLMLILVFYNNGFSQCQNRALDYDGVDDYVEINSNITGFPLTIEGWFKSTSTSINSTCNGEGEILLSCGDGTGNSFVEIGECNGSLFINSIGPGSNPTLFQLINTIVNPNAINIRNNWHHISIITLPVLGNWEYQVYLDCNLIYNAPWTGAGNPHVWLGTSQNSATLSKTFQGQTDDFRIWNTIRTTQELCDSKNCVLQTTNTNLADYYKFDQGNPAMSNLTETMLNDDQSPAANGILHNFNLTSNTSNWICSSAPIIYPDLSDTDLAILDYPGRTNSVSSICSGEPLHFCVSHNGNPITPNPNIDVLWQFNDGSGSGWFDLDPTVFNGFCFAVPPDKLIIDCSANQVGYEDWEIRTKYKVNDPSSGGANPCVYYSKPKNLRICCPLDMTQIKVTTNDPNNLVCDIDIADFQVSIISAYPFLTTPASGVTIDWKYNGVPLPSFANQTSFSYPSISIDINSGACFDATITSCGKTENYTKCFNIDPVPQCGSIKDAMNPNNLTFISIDVYEICPGEDASLMIDIPFNDCIPTWQYRFDQVSAWSDLSSTNSMQNTNILPSNLWPVSATKIYYRIECRPISDPSGCEPCHSNEILIQLDQQPSAGTISGPNFICFGSSVILTHSGLDPALTHQWYCNGDPVGSGTATLSTSNGGCYWVESTDGCHNISTQKHCMDLCIITPIISCPDVCPRPGVPITLSACNSEDTCGQSLSYQWTVTGGNTPTINGCNITHIPSPGSNTYSVTVTNAYGCSATTSATIVPCAE